MDSPRGRIYQIVQVDAGRLALSDSFVSHIDRCLGCLNCQTACPSGVAYGSLLEQARAQIAENYKRPWLATKLRQHFYRDILPSFRSLAGHARFIRFYQRSGLQSLARGTGILKLLGMEELDALSPRMESDFSFQDLGRVIPAEG
jgi:glycolate oxidase iron-sulfur subunit